ncbi:MAG TPA: hypothetical protein ENO29_07340 [Candidatus Aminicenantes bacterium]|nr:MAG: hypothetical protein C0168_06105 [Candidatus Aminicenantes bacterium]HEK86149.1 hypothetical protein [Candidatus Aminicenantes bacterium]
MAGKGYQTMKKSGSISIKIVFLVLVSIFLISAEAAAREKYSTCLSPAMEGHFSGQEENRPAIDELHDQIATFISGLPTALPSLLTLQEGPIWKNFSNSFNSVWEKTKAKRLTVMETWAATKLAEARSKTKTVFYPFGGPDLLTAYLLFPEAETYILVGLEPPGNLPEIQSLQSISLESYLNDLQEIMSDYLNKSYFITHKMNEELDERKINGVLPLICIFLKRTDNLISEIKRVEFDDSGNPLESEYQLSRARIKRPVGFKINFFKKDSTRVQTVYYISCDLSDERFSPQSKFFLFLNRYPDWTTFIKSASYLLHYKNFINLRQLLLERSSFLLQDDTGIPYRYFKNEDWDIQLYGRYAKPVKDFSGVEQPDLKSAYQDKTKVKPLPFHLGYHWGTNLDCLMLLKRKLKPAEVPR